MAFNAYDASSREARILRADAGDHIKRLRIAAKLTQRKLSDLLGLEYYTFISQLECGQGRLPPKLWIKTAEALGQEPSESQVPKQCNNVVFESTGDKILSFQLAGSAQSSPPKFSLAPQSSPWFGLFRKM